MITFRALLYGCWPGGHGDMLRERIKGRYVLRCAVCGTTRVWPRQRLRLKRTERGLSKALRFPTRGKRA